VTALDIVTEAINDNGQVLGARNLGSTFLWENGKARKIGADFELPRGFNNKGQVIGAKGPHAFLWDNGKMKDLGTLGGSRSVALAINDLGQVVGWAQLSINEDEHAFIWENGEMKDLGAFPGYNTSIARSINDKGHIVGNAHALTRKRVFLWQDGKWQDLGIPPGSREIEATKINNAGQVVGLVWVPEVHCLLWENGRMQDLVLADYCQANDINDRGQVVGLSGKTGFLWERGKMQSLNELIDPHSGWRILGASHINNRGQILAAATLKEAYPVDVLLTPWTTP